MNSLYVSHSVHSLEMGAIDSFALKFVGLFVHSFVFSFVRLFVRSLIFLLKSFVLSRRGEFIETLAEDVTAYWSKLRTEINSFIHSSIH